MTEHRISGIPYGVIKHIIVLVALVSSLITANAAETPVVTNVEPAVVQQGDTVLLTITGENIPTGTVVVEFFPQQIALLDVLSSDAGEVVAQIKVPSLAQPGKYNILIYNQLGEELFAEGLLEISSQVITPVFRDFQPKTIGEAAEGFALLLTGESITPEVIEHLSMQWSLNGTKLDKLTTVFSYGTHGQVLCAITGPIPGGLLQGRINLDGKPIYMVEVHNQTVQAMIVGQQPTVMSSEQNQYQVNFLGTDFTAAFVAGLEISLETETLSAKATTVDFVDGSSFNVTFSGPLPVADYTIKVMQSGEDLFIGGLLLTVQEVVEAQTEDDVVDLDISQESTTPEVQTAVQVPDTTKPAGENVTAPMIVGLTPNVISPGQDPASFAFSSTGLTPEQYDRLEVRLILSGTDCQLLFMGAGRDSCTCLFAPPTGGWVEGNVGDFIISDPQSEVADFSAQVSVSVDLFEPVAEQFDSSTDEKTTSSPMLESVLAPDFSQISISNANDLEYELDLIGGSVVPDSLRIKLETTAEAGFATDQIGVTFDPEPANPQSAFFMQLSGQTLNILVDLTAWQVDQLEQGLAVELISSLKAEWSPGPTVSIPNRNHAVPETGSAIRLGDDSLVDNAGFVLEVFMDDDRYSAAELENVKVDSDNSLLKINLDKFSIKVRDDKPSDGRRTIKLVFERDDEMLDEIAYWLLMEGLIEGSGTRISLVWPGINISASTEIRFLRDN